MDKTTAYSEVDLQAFELEYKSVLSSAERFGEELLHQIERLLEEQGIALGFPIQRRVKAWSSLSEKLERIGFQVTSVTDFQDLIGLRLIFLFKRDIARVCDLISQNFNVIKQYDTQERMKDDRFGYSSVHFVVELRHDWLAIPTFSKMAGSKAEIQIRTLAQHTWAEASHNLQYKRKESVPVEISRAINRVSALLETVDLEFERVLDQRDAYREEVDISGTTDLLNVDIIEKTLDDLLPAANKGDEEYANLLDDLVEVGINTQQQLRDIIEKHLAQVLEFDQGAAWSYQKHHRINKVPFNERLERGVFFNHAGLVRFALRKEFPAFDDYLKQKVKRRELLS